MPAPTLPADLVEDFSHGGQPTREQLYRLMELKGAKMGMDLPEALNAAQKDQLPHTPVGVEFRYLAEEWRVAPVR